MTDVQDFHKELFREKSLMGIYIESMFLSETRFDQLVKLLTFIFLTGFVVYVDWGSTGDRQKIFALLYAWASLGFTYTTQILGFLLAGFTIFATMTKVHVFIMLAQTPHRNTQVSELKFMFFNFIRVFIGHLTLLALSVAVLMFKGMPEIIRPIFEGCPCIFTVGKIFTGSVGLIAVGSFLVSSLLQLKSFIWNLYQSVLIAILGEFELDKFRKSTSP